MPLPMFDSSTRTIGLNRFHVLHRNFVIEYIPKFQKTIWKNFMEKLNFVTISITDFPKEFENILRSTNMLLSRVYSYSQKEAMLDNLRLEVCRNWLDSPTIEKKNESYPKWEKDG